MNLSIKARKAMAAGLAASTVLMTASLGIAPAFAAPHSNGCLVLSGGTVWLITGGVRRGFTSAEVFTSHGYNFGQVISANADDVALSQGPIMIYADGTLVKGPSDPLVYLVANGQKRGFTSGTVFTNLGFSFASIQWAPTNTFMDIPLGANIDGTTSYSSIPHSGPGPQTPTCSGSTPSTPSGDLTGEGTVADFSVGSPEDTTVSEDQSDVELVAFDVELNDDGSLRLDRFDLYMGQDNTVTASNKPWDYFTDAHLMVNGDEVDSMSVDSSSDWSEYDTGTLGTTSQEYRLRFSGLSAILDSDETSTVSVSFDMVSNLDSADEDAVWQFGTETDSFRFTDATNFVFTDGEDLASSFALDTADEAALVLSASADEPDAQVIEVSDSNDTVGVTLGEFEIEETQDVDVNITEMTVALTTSDTITDVVRTLYLMNGSTEVGQENVTSGTVTFDNLDLDVDAGDTVTLTVEGDLKDTNDQVRYQDGDTVSASAVNLTAYTDEFDNDENDFTESGSYAGNSHALYANGMRAEFVSASTEKTFTADAATEDDQGTYKIVFDVTAFGEDVYIDADTEDDNGTDAVGQGAVFDINSTAGTPTVSSKLLEAEGVESGDVASTSFMVPEGTTRTFTLTVILTADSTPTDGSHQVILESINWDNEANGTDATPDFFYNFDMGDYKTDYLFLNGIT